ncbi:hypothetical protein C8J56DRAFT_396463 [Mycena floridula]|nr:hypothetical protein C8J56DRAFT_396463 [Mycena floridula]
MQMFVEAKRHQPSVIYVPEFGRLIDSDNSVYATLLPLLSSLLASLPPSAPILVVAVVEATTTQEGISDRDSLDDEWPPEALAMFKGAVRIAVEAPSVESRRLFFKELLDSARKPSANSLGLNAVDANGIPLGRNGKPKKKRVLEKLEIAPPLPPPEPSREERERVEEADRRLVAVVKFRLGPVIGELKRKFKRFGKGVRDSFST